MYESFYGLSGKPFSLLPDADFLFFSKKHKNAINILEYSSITQSGFVVISGEVGAGKTTTIRHYLNKLGTDVNIGMITNTSKSFGNPLRWVATAFELEDCGQDDVLTYNCFVEFLITQYALGKRAVLIIDEAQNLTIDMLEDLRMLSNVNNEKDAMLQIVLAGQPSLLANLQHPDLQQLVQRISVHCHLAPLEAIETAAYIRHRLGIVGGDPQLFDDTACAAIHFFTDGVPRLINLLCDHSMMYAFAEDQKHVSFPVIVEVVNDRDNAGLSAFRNVAKGRTETELLNKFTSILGKIRAQT